MSGVMNYKLKAKRDAASKLENGSMYNKPRAITGNRIFSEDCKDRKYISKDCSRTPISRGNKKILSKSPFDSKNNKGKNNEIIVYRLASKVYTEWTKG
jgi:hypothetical protein